MNVSPIMKLPWNDGRVKRVTSVPAPSALVSPTWQPENVRLQARRTMIRMDLILTNQAGEGHDGECSSQHLRQISIKNTKFNCSSATIKT